MVNTRYKYIVVGVDDPRDFECAKYALKIGFLDVPMCMCYFRFQQLYLLKQIYLNQIVLNVVWTACSIQYFWVAVHIRLVWCVTYSILLTFLTMTSQFLAMTYLP